MTTFVRSVNVGSRTASGVQMVSYVARSLIAVFAATVALAQVQAPTEFDNASVSLNTANDRIVTIDVGPGAKFAARGYTLVLLMQRAYRVMDWNVSGGPDWIRTDRFDVSANAIIEGNLTEEQLRPMLQKLLAERFKLRLHPSSKEMAGYALLVSKSGPKLKPASDGAEHPDTFRMNSAGLSGQGTRMEDLARYVGGKLGLVAMDMTGLKGVYDVKVDWSSQQDQFTDGFGGVDRDAWRRVVLMALENQLGLKLNPQTITVPMLVIDSVEKVLKN